MQYTKPWVKLPLERSYTLVKNFLCHVNGIDIDIDNKTIPLRSIYRAYLSSLLANTTPVTDKQFLNLYRQFQKHYQFKNSGSQLGRKKDAR